MDPKPKTATEVAQSRAHPFAVRPVDVDKVKLILDGAIRRAVATQSGLGMPTVHLASMTMAFEDGTVVSYEIGAAKEPKVAATAPPPVAQKKPRPD